ncbi:class I SAM-dependent methyltransferase [Marinivivus vitaminiproducens]|uniref:class I SAM-dependent methyltransferase n=1 Tax=Marinivivus vitaminiproducens TaxID=3035935 RepID=UPI00279F7487|nr:class I SAM-dependent methyltransferase [Geminicoccaceae bacterium SCSIO 64248]
MRFDEIRAIVDGVPMLTVDQGRGLYDFVLEHKPETVMELGVFHGVSTCYIGAALQKLGRGRIISVDRAVARDLKPGADALLKKAGLRDMVELHYEERSYTWFLMKHLETQLEPHVDFCFLDGAHTWDIDGLSFFLVDRLMRPGGWIVLDDLDWRISDSENLKNPDFLRDVVKDVDFMKRTPLQEQETAQVRKVWELLIQRHPQYGNFRETEDWGYAQKLESATREAAVVVQERPGVVAEMRRLLRRVKARVAH